MSLNSVVRAANDGDLQLRIQASVNAEARANPDLNDTEFAHRVKDGAVDFTAFYWSVAQAVQNEYESGIVAGRGSPGHDADVVTDGAITSAVVANWPLDPEPPEPVEP